MSDAKRSLKNMGVRCWPIIALIHADLEAYLHGMVLLAKYKATKAALANPPDFNLQGYQGASTPTE
ncbi:hypothetical protein M7I_1143 [Glarea lozoyensis 74030]|uniref:Uncharacterized protein n=1 Tax=Glarea lozoyensis (strain ATCC 74030 / MF5533) TaxID=1104152 RepID=H0EFA1_GLAL7|nr:hypothetical protein M7I_1143 [Glarea lozoyensis 74030]